MKPIRKANGVDLSLGETQKLNSDLDLFSPWVPLVPQDDV